MLIREEGLSIEIIAEVPVSTKDTRVPLPGKIVDLLVTEIADPSLDRCTVTYRGEEPAWVVFSRWLSRKGVICNAVFEGEQNFGDDVGWTKRMTAHSAGIGIMVDRATHLHLIPDNPEHTRLAIHPDSVGPFENLMAIYEATDKVITGMDKEKAANG